jgi:hypothetical protein
MKRLIVGCAAILSLACAARLHAQTAAGTLEISARVTPTSAKSEPVRDFTLYLLTRSYADICKEVEASNVMLSRNEFIDKLKVSSELREWLKKHDVLDLTMPGIDKIVTPDDIIHVPEFLAAYERTNSGGVTHGFPRPKYKEGDKANRPERYARLREDYLAALRKFMQAHPESISGIEMELDAISPARQWAALQHEHKKRVQRLAPAAAQTKYLVGKVDTDLNGMARVSGLPAGNYWISSLNLDADAGDTRLRWDVPFTITAGQVTAVNLSNLNASDNRAPTTP